MDDGRMRDGGVTPVDLLVFGPHPDDIEIGAGGAVARHVDLGLGVGLCDLTAGEMGSNGTVSERLAEAEAARAVLGATWRINLRWPDRAIGRDLEHVRAAALVISAARPRASAIPYGQNRHPEQAGAHAGRRAPWLSHLRWPDRAIGRDLEHVRAAALVIRAARPRAIAIPYGEDRHPDHVAAHRVLTDAIFNAGLRRFDAEGAPWKPE